MEGVDEKEGVEVRVEVRVGGGVGAGGAVGPWLVEGGTVERGVEEGREEVEGEVLPVEFL